MGKYFGTDGFRGEANEVLTSAKAFKIGRYLGWYYGQKHEDGRARIIIGKDTRRSSYTLEYALSTGITAKSTLMIRPELSSGRIHAVLPTCMKQPFLQVSLPPALMLICFMYPRHLLYLIAAEQTDLTAVL